MDDKKSFIEKLCETSVSMISRNKRSPILFKKKFDGYTVLIKPFNLFEDLNLLHTWVNKPYAKQFWGMQGKKKMLFQHYEKFLQSGKGYALLFFIKGSPVAFMEYYQVKEDELKQHYDYSENDYGVHLLMAPPTENKIDKLSQNVMITCIAFLFTLSIDRIMGEPDINNKPANALVQKVGFRFMKPIQLSYKKANLYYYDKADFFKEHGV